MSSKLLVVDDSQTVRQEVRAALKGSGFEIIEAVDGFDGVNRIERNPDLAIVICDVNMPNMNGLELLATVRNAGNNASLPIVMLTTEGRADLISQARSLGAKGWLVKPFKPEQLIATVKKLARAA